MASKWIQVKADEETQAAKTKLIKAGYNISALVRAYLIKKAREV